MAASYQPFTPGAAVVPSTEVEISISCRGLKDKDVFSKSDPMCVVYSKNMHTDQYHESGRTEMVKDNLNPEFVKKITMTYMFEESQKLRFDVYDVDSPSGRLDNHDFLGRMECTLGEIIGSPSGRLDRPLMGPGKNCGKITVRAEEIANCKERVHFQFQAKKLDKKDFFGKSDPYLVFYRSNEDNSYTVVHKTEVIKNTLNPTWRPFSLKARVLCNGDFDRSIKIECYDWDSDGGHDLIGEFFTNMRTLTKGSCPENVYEVIHPKKKAKKKSYKNSGTVTLMSVRVEMEHSFLDFIKGGMQMNFTVAVDFTASNGNPTSATSLHYISPYQPNQYVSALRAVGEIIQDYDSDKMFPALGFGARIPPSGIVSHEFPLNGNPANPFCSGIGGVEQAYQTTLRQVQLYGPTNFSPVINHVAKFASAYPDGSNYFVLLILTDGVISDMAETKAAIVHAANLPMSIIIVGVGDAEFDAMEELDGDDVRIQSRGKYAVRDIVQFVPFREFIGNRHGSNIQYSQALLAKEVLAEIPDQVVGYMKMRGISPQPPKSDITLPGDQPSNQGQGQPQGHQYSQGQHGGYPAPAAPYPPVGGYPPSTPGQAGPGQPPPPAYGQAVLQQQAGASAPLWNS